MFMPNKSSCEPHTEERNRYFTISRPTAHEGISRALRRAYRQRENELPVEMMELLGKLNHTPL
jgi:hypothetical protein